MDGEVEDHKVWGWKVWEWESLKMRNLKTRKFENDIGWGWKSWTWGNGEEKVVGWKVEQSKDEKAEKEEKVGDAICAKRLTEWLGMEEEPPGSWSHDDVSMQDFSSHRYIFIYHEDSHHDQWQKSPKVQLPSSKWDGYWAQIFTAHVVDIVEDIVVNIAICDEYWAYIFATEPHVVDVEGDNGHGGGKGDEADGDAVVESCKLQSEI